MKIEKAFNIYERPESKIPKDTAEKVGKFCLFFADNALGSKISETGEKTDKVANKLLKTLSGLAAFTFFLPLLIVGVVVIRFSKSFEAADRQAEKSAAEKVHTETLKHLFPNGNISSINRSLKPYDSKAEIDPIPQEPSLNRRKSLMPPLPPAPSRVNSMELPKKPLLPPDPSMKREEILDPEDLHGLSETEKPPSLDEG